MATDTADAPEVRLNEIRQEWGLDVDEATGQAQMEAVKLLAVWLNEAKQSAPVVVRAVQTLLADPEQSGINKRPAISEIVRKVSMKWTNAGVKPEGMMGLQGMLLAAWPQDTRSDNFSLVSLFDSAWELTKGRERQRERIGAWRFANIPAPALPITEIHPITTTTIPSKPQTQELPEPAAESLLKYTAGHYGIAAIDAAPLSTLLAKYRNSIVSLAAKEKNIISAINAFIPKLAGDIESAIKGSLERSQSQQALLWWGQSRYSHAARKPYRRMQDSTERLWWMTWEASELALNLDAEPSASYLVEVLHQLGEELDTLRPLKEWLSELAHTLRRLHENEQHRELIEVGKELDDLASKDALGLPVTWARLEAGSSRSLGSGFEDRAKAGIALDLDTPISRGDWAVWLFRESLLDRRL